MSEKVVIVGGGVSGLVAGIYAQKSGYNTVIVEKHAITGGQLTGWNRAGHHIDNCIHWLTGTNKNVPDHALWLETGMLDGENVYRGESLYTYEKDGATLSLYADINRLEREMISLSPKDEKKIRSFISDVKTAQGLCGIAGETHDGGITFHEKIMRVPKLIKYGLKSVGDFSKTFENEVIRGFLCSILGEWFSSAALVAVFATFTGDNGGVPAGGSALAAKRMTEKYLSLGGETICGFEVGRINLDKGRAFSVSAKDGREIGADAVIVTAEPETVFGKMLASPMPRSLKRRYESDKTRRFSAVHCAFSCNKSEVGFKGDLIFDLDDDCARSLGSKRLILREFSHEPGFAPDGKTVLQSMAFVSEDECKKYLRAKTEGGYEEMKKIVECATKDAVLRKFPALSESLTTLDVWTPATYREYTLTDVGSFMSFAFTGGVLPRPLGGKIKGIKNVFLATQWQSAPGGLPLAAAAGRSSVALLVKYFVYDEKKAKRSERTGAASKRAIGMR